MIKLKERQIMTAVPPETKTIELRVATTAATDDLTPTSSKQIRVLGIMASFTVTGGMTSTVRSTIAFGEDHTTETDKILASFRAIAANDNQTMWISPINVIGEIDEVIRLTNTTYSAGAVITRAVIYYREE